MHHRDLPLVDTVMDSRGCAFHLLLSPCHPGLVSNGKSHFGHGSFRRGASSRERHTTYRLYPHNKAIPLKFLLAVSFMFNTFTYLTTLKFYIKFRQVPDQLQTLPINFYEEPNVLPGSAMNILVTPIYVADTELLTY
jgi:hypothetical protein